MKLFFLLFFLMVCWFIFLKLIFSRLKKYYTEEYKALGEPGVLWNNSLRNNFLFAKFLFTRKYKKLNDNFMQISCDLMLVLLVIYFLTLTLFVFLMAKGIL